MHHKVNLEIDYNWSKVREFYHRLVKDTANGKFNQYAHEYPHEENGPMTIYGISNYGSIMHSDDLSKNWNIWTGQLLENMIPWFPEAKELFKNLKLDTIKFGSNTSSVKKHVDGTFDSDPICNLTYIISNTDPNAKTISYNVNDPKITKATPSIPGTAYLLDTQAPHEIISDGPREVFQFCFKNDFNYIVNELNNIGPIRLKG